MPILDPLTVRLDDRPNVFLVCPAGRCASTPQATAQVYDLPAGRLAEAWTDVLRAAPRVAFEVAADDPLLILGTQRTQVLRFVDDFTVRILPIEDDRSSFAAISRSRVGYYDFGTNRRRLEGWIARLPPAADGS